MCLNKNVVVVVVVFWNHAILTIESYTVAKTMNKNNIFWSEIGSGF